MADTLLRLGLWSLIIVLALFVVSEAFDEQAFAELISTPLLTQALVVSGATIAASFVLRILGVGAKVVSKNRCQTCRTPIPSGAIYCREHLRNILAEEDERTHMTKIRRR